MENLGDLGFWLAVGAVIVALIVRGWLKERDKQALLRDLMKAEGEGKVSEVLAYLRERDAAEDELTRKMWGLGTGGDRKDGKTGAIAVATIVGIVALLGGLISLALLSERTDSGLVPIYAMTAFWLVGGAMAWLIVALGGEKKNGSSPDA